MAENESKAKNVWYWIAAAALIVGFIAGIVADVL